MGFSALPKLLPRKELLRPSGSCAHPRRYLGRSWWQQCSPSSDSVPAMHTQPLSAQTPLPSQQTRSKTFPHKISRELALGLIAVRWTWPSHHFLLAFINPHTQPVGQRYLISCRTGCVTGGNQCNCAADTFLFFPFVL